jgi:hypothetical protein
LAELLEELLVSQVDAVAKRVLAEVDLERNDLDAVALAPLGRQVGSRIGDYTEAA